MTEHSASSHVSVFTEQPAIVELMGHQVIAGHISEEEHAGTKMLRVDVPEVNSQPAFTKFFGGSAVYAITPTNEASMLVAAAQMRVRPVALYVLPELPAPGNGPEWDDFDDEDWTDPDRIP